jgi:hypothetical protein
VTTRSDDGFTAAAPTARGGVGCPTGSSIPSSSMFASVGWPQKESSHRRELDPGKITKLKFFRTRRPSHSGRRVCEHIRCSFPFSER